MPCQDDTLYRMHRFRTPHTPIKGLTSDILVRPCPPSYLLSQIAHPHYFPLLISSAQIETASIAFSPRKPNYPIFPPGQDRSTWDIAIESVVRESLEDGWEERRKVRESAVQH